MTSRKWLWAIQTVVAAIVVVLVVRTLLANWSDLQSTSVNLQFRWLPVVGAVFLVVLAFAFLIAAWRTILLGWQQRLPYLTGAKIWCLSNFGRYLPGKVWSIAGMGVMATKAGVNPIAAGASAVVMQALAIGAGTAVAAVTLTSSGGSFAPVLLIAVVLSVGTVAGLRSPYVLNLMAKILGDRYRIDRLSLRAVLSGFLTTMIAWILYGLAFWQLSGAILAAPVDLPLATGTFALGYIVGLVALFAPGGIGAREGVLVSVLTPHIGAGEAIALAIASRILMTGAEVVAALLALVFAPTSIQGDQA